MTPDKIIDEFLDLMATATVGLGITLDVRIEPGRDWGLSDGRMVIVDDHIVVWSTGQSGSLWVDETVDASDPSVGLFNCIEPRSWSAGGAQADVHDCSRGVPRNVVVNVMVRLLEFRVDTILTNAEADRLEQLEDAEYILDDMHVN
jgi:hypothetical protein